MRILLLTGAIALLGGWAQTEQPAQFVFPEQERLVGGAVRTAPVPQVVVVDPPRAVDANNYGPQRAPSRFNEPIQVRKNFAPELDGSAGNL
jgi:hypothetical protein